MSDERCRSRFSVRVPFKVLRVIRTPAPNANDEHGSDERRTEREHERSSENREVNDAMFAPFQDKGQRRC
jgi:hypothetical protein